MASGRTSRGGPAPPSIMNTKNNSTPTPWAARAVGMTEPKSAPRAANATVTSANAPSTDNQSPR
jgi:hypothetical protein